MNAQPKSKTFRALRVTQPIGDFFVAVLDSSVLVDIAYADVRELEARTLDRYLGINRRLDESRVKVIASYVKTQDATFPTSILLAIDGRNVNWDEAAGL